MKKYGFFAKYDKKNDGVIRGFDVKTPGVKLLCIVIVIICTLIALFALFPAVWVFLASFRELEDFIKVPRILPESIEFSKFVDTWKNVGFVKYYLNSFILLAGGCVCAVFFNGLMAYGLAIIKPKGYKVINTLVLLSMLIPPATGVVALFVNINKLGLNGSFLPLWLGYGASAFNVIIFKNFFEGQDKSLREAAMLDGCNEFQVFTKIVLPLSMPIIAVVVIFTITASWSDYLMPYLVLNHTGKETVMVKLFEYRDAKGVNLMEEIRAVFFTLAPPAILFLLFQRKITDGAAAGAVKG